MQEYDVTLKVLLQGNAVGAMRQLTGTVVARWLDVELPKVQNLRVDLLGETVEGELVHIELQSSNDASMALRMAEYSLGVYRLCGAFPRQVLVYVGQEALRMEPELRGPDLLFRYRLIDIRDLDGERLLESERIADNIIAILARLRDHKEAVRTIVARIGDLPETERRNALEQLLILAGLRRLAQFVEQEARNMPMHINILENEVLGPVFKRGLEEGHQEGRQEGEMAILRRLIEKRFGKVPGWVGEKLRALSAAELEELSVRLLDARSLEELLP